MARTCQMTEAMRNVCERAMAAEAEPMLDGVSGRTAPPERPRDEDGRQDDPGEERGDPRPLRQQARQRLPRGANYHMVRQEGDQRLSQRRAPRHRDLPRAGGYRSSPSLALRPNPCYPPETPKSLIFGYRCLSFALASALVNCQSTPPPRALRSSSHALQSLQNVS